MSVHSSKQSSELLFAEFLRSIGLDVDGDPHLKDTPARFTRMLCEQTKNYRREPKFTTSAHYDAEKEIKLTVFDAKGADELIIEKDVSFVSLCSHHLAAITGVVHIGYLPNQHIVGISKLARIADFYAARPQTQEYLTEQIARALFDLIKPKFLGVLMIAEHNCISCRGPRKIGAKTITSKYLPNTMHETKSEFLRLVL